MVNRNEFNGEDDQSGRKNVRHEEVIFPPGGAIPCGSPQNEQKPARISSRTLHMRAVGNSFQGQDL